MGNMCPLYPGVEHWQLSSDAPQGEACYCPLNVSHQAARSRNAGTGRNVCVYMCGSIRPYPLCPLAVLPSLRSSSGSSTPSFFLCVSLHQSLNTVFSVGLLLVSPASRASLSPCEGQGPRGKRSRNAQVQLRTDLQLSARITFFTSVCVFFFKKNTFDNEG